MTDLKSIIRDVPDFPKPGIVFKDITTLLRDPGALDRALNELTAPYEGKHIDLVVGVESRGFIFGAAAARQLKAGFVPVRKPGKLPAETVREEYTLEYGTDAVEMHRDAIQAGQKVLIMDDLLATGGTAAATVALVEKLGGEVAGAAFLIELVFLQGRKKLGGIPVHALIRYDAE